MLKAVKLFVGFTAFHSIGTTCKICLFIGKNKQISHFFPICSFYSNIYCTFAPTNALVAKLVDALDLGSSGLGRVGSSPIRRTEENPNCLIISG